MQPALEKRRKSISTAFFGDPASRYRPFFVPDAYEAMNRLASCLILIIGLTVGVQTGFAQQARSSFEHWHTGGVGLSTPLGFNAGASYSVVVKGPLFVQAQASISKDIYVTKHSVLAFGPALGLRHYTEVALTSLSVGPTYIRGTRGADLLAPGVLYESAAMTVTAQMIFREVNMGFELYTNVSPIRTVSGLRVIYRFGRFR